jgi:diguanylate cyclase (GGDEF)-like protein
VSSFFLTPNLWKTCSVVVFHWLLLMTAAQLPHDLSISRDGLLTGLIALGLPLYVLAGISLWRQAARPASELDAQDDLTGLGNRQAFISEAKSMLKHAKAGSRALVLVDIDGLKAFNNRCGHQAGDELLVAVADRLVAENRRVYRTGGDEFAILIDRMEGEAVTACLQLLEPFNMHFETCGHEHRVCFTYGYASINNNEGFESLYRRAELCLAEIRRQLYASGDRADRRSRSREELRSESVARANARAQTEVASQTNISSLDDRRRERPGLTSG